ncbi:MAG: DUF547 domain-containing protein [Bacteroidota bacterium]
MHYHWLILILLLPFFSYAQQALDASFFDQADQFFKAEVQNGKLDYTKLKNNTLLARLVAQIEDIDLKEADEKSKQAFYINAYNLLVIHQILANSPVPSVKEIKGFFNQIKVEVAQEQLSLNELEKEKLLKPYKDARFHLALVCGALDCPPLADFAYRPEQLEAQLEAQTKLALNHPRFIRVSGNNVGLSEIFRWYSHDFGNSKRHILQFINQYRAEAISESAKVYYYVYDWSLNQITDQSQVGAIANNAARYVVSMAIPKGTTETKIFNNLYTERTQRDADNNLTQRASFFTTWASFLYGVNNRFNLGFDLRYRRVNNTPLPSSPLDIFNFSTGRNRAALSQIGPKIRWAPSDKLPHFSVQSAFWFPFSSDLEGNGEMPFLDWDSYIWWTQFFNDKSVGSNFSLFTEIDFIWEDIGTDQLNRISTPATVILSYFPHPQVTLYGMANVAPTWYKDLDIFAQAGVGAKYQFNPQLEVELLYTAFTNAFLFDSNGRAGTYNIGVRFNK